MNTLVFGLILAVLAGVAVISQVKAMKAEIAGDQDAAEINEMVRRAMCYSNFEECGGVYIA